MNAIVRRASGRGRLLLRKAADLRLGQIAGGLVAAAVAGIGGVASFGVTTGPRWAAGYLALYAADKLFGRIRHGEALRTYTNSLEQVNGKVAGAIDTLVMQFARAPDARLAEADAHALCVALLSRIKEHAVLAYQLGPDAPMRVTLAVPHTSALGDRVDCLRVWCYDGPHPDRRYSTLPLDAAGAPAAFMTGRPQTIDDVNAVTGGSGSADLPRRYASVASIPVVAGGAEGKRLAVVSLDMRPASFFRAATLDQQLLPMVAPIVNLIALTLTMRREEPYEFNR